MIERNLGNAERVIRLVMGLLFGGWALSQTPLNGGEWALVALFVVLVLNGIFSRCYLWYLFDINTAGRRNSGSAGPQCQTEV
jgi:hypothetical protein